jgi:uncharacterized protein YebE (UPF0316 family)
MTLLLLIFCCGAAYEITSVFWVFSTEKLKPWHAAFWSMIQAFVMITGIGESLHNNWAKLCFIVGYSFGSFIAILVKKQLGKTP